MDISDKAVFPALAGDAIDADVDHDRARLDPIAFDEFRPPDSRHEQISALGNLGQ